MTIISLDEYRRKRDLEAVRIASAICKREQRIREHEEAMIALNKFYKLESVDGSITD